MTSWNPYDPCSVGDLRLPAQFETLRWAPLHCNTKTGHPTRAWVHLPADLVISWQCATEHGHEVEIWRCGALALTRPMTEDERADWICDQYDPADWA